MNLLLQNILPHHILSRLIAKIANSRICFLKNFIIKQYCDFYKIDMSDAIESNPLKYHTFNDFFTRALQPGARKIDGDDKVIVNPLRVKQQYLFELENNLLLYYTSTSR